MADLKSQLKDATKKEQVLINQVIDLQSKQEVYEE